MIKVFVMKKYITVLAGLLLLLFTCGKDVKIKDSSWKPVRNIEPGTIKYWLDKETSTVHKMTCNGTDKSIVSIIKYRDGMPLEVMKIIKSGNINGRLHWAYFVPSTKYIVELTALSLTENEIKFEWKNKAGDGVEKSGRDILVNCNEYGIISGNN